MATQDLEKLIVKLDADLRSYERALAKAQGVTTTQMRKVEKQAEASATRVESAFSSISKTFAKGLIAAATVETVRRAGEAIIDVVESTARLGDVADRVGITTDQLQALSVAAVQADVDFEDLAKGLLKFTKEAGNARRGQGDLAKQLVANGRQFTGNTFQDLKTLADLVSNTANEQDAATLSSLAFGKSFEGWTEILAQGGQGLDDLVVKLNETGAAIDSNLVKKVQKTEDFWAGVFHDMGVTVKNGTLQALLATGEAVRGISEAVSDLGHGLLGLLTGAGRARAGASDDVRNLIGGEVLRPAPGAGTVSPRLVPIPRRKPSQPKTKIVGQDEIKEAERLKELRIDLIETTREYDETRAASVADGIKGAQEEAKQLEFEARTLGMSTERRETYLKQQELINLAVKNGIVLTPDLITNIDRAAEAYGKAAQKAEDLHQRQEVIDEINGTVKDSFSSFVSDVRSGVAPVEALTNALSHLAERLEDLAIDTAFNALTKPGGPAAGGIGALIAKAFGFAKGGIMTSRGPVPLRSYAGGGVANSPQIAMYGEGSRPEAFVPLPDGKRIPVNLSLPSLAGMGARGGGTQVNIYNSGPGQVRTEDRNGPNGMKMLDVYIDQKVGQFIGGQKGAKLMGAAYGLRPKLTRR
jgi:hypothetical protein